MTGQLYDFPLKRVETHGLPGDVTARYQPAVELPVPFVRQGFRMEDVTRRTPEATASVLPIVQRGNLGPCTRDKKIRAFDADTGAELWSHQLEFHGTAPPASYEVDGRQFIVLPATGGGKLGGPASDSWVAFALPR